MFFEAISGGNSTLMASPWTPDRPIRLRVLRRCLICKRPHCEIPPPPLQHLAAAVNTLPPSLSLSLSISSPLRTTVFSSLPHSVSNSIRDRHRSLMQGASL
uniref:Uncharacterized protein n=1 Tax=Nelumbo nucifera TaxID=4432 RepID=A0A822ZGW1_NELNU|nr:TPA_asm: hypothetical protein HUJ06_000496 [Nelumbo nucifera]